MRLSLQKHTVQVLALAWSHCGALVKVLFSKIFRSCLNLSCANWTFPTSAESGGSSGSLTSYKLVYYTKALTTFIMG